MKAPAAVKTLSARFYKNIFKSIEKSPKFFRFLYELACCIERRIDVTPLENWWDKNNHLIECTHNKEEDFKTLDGMPWNALLEFEEFLGRIELVQPSKKDNTATSISVPKVTKKSQKLTYPQLPWVDFLFAVSERYKNQNAHTIYINYSRYLEKYASQKRCRIEDGVLPFEDELKPSKVQIGSNESAFLAKIGSWLSKNSGINNLEYVFETIFGTRSTVVKNSGDIFRAACQCPNLIFTRFMQSDFSGYDFSDGKALIHILSLPLNVNVSGFGPAHLNPEYPFYDNDIFPSTFKLSDKDRKKLITSWQRFFQQYNILNEKYLDLRIFGGGKLFNLVVNSLKGEETEINSSELSSILYDTNPNIWCVQYWLHSIVLTPETQLWSLGIFSRLGESEPELARFFCVIAQYIYDQGAPDIASRLLMTGMTTLYFFSNENEESILNVIGDNFPALFNMRRTDAFLHLGLNNFFKIMEWNKFDSQSNLTKILNRLSTLLNNPSIEDIVRVGNETHAIKDNSPVIVEFDLSKPEYQSKTNHEIINLVMRSIAAASNTNGGDVLITIPVANNYEPSPLEQDIEKSLKSLLTSALSNDFHFIKKTRIAGTSDKMTIWMQCYRSEHPVFLNRKGVSGLITFEIPKYKIRIQYGEEANKEIKKRFPMINISPPVVLSC